VGAHYIRGEKWRKKSREEKRSIRRAFGAKDMRLGCLIFAAGLCLTVCCTGLVFAPDGGYVIFTGPMILGFVLFVGGLRAMRR
jgi:hypothetical protein